jgi:hypothetical protein
VLQKSLLIAATMSFLVLAECASAQVVQEKDKGKPNLPDLRNGAAPGSLLWAGARLSKADADLQVQLGLADKEGLVVATVAPGSAAESAGLKPDDVLVRINGKPVPNTLDGFSSLLKEQKLDAGADLDIIRGGKEETIRSARVPGIVQLIAPSSNPRRVIIRRVTTIGGVKLNRNREGDEFSGSYVKGDLKITVKGNLKDEQNMATIVIIRAGERKTYTNLTDVPGEYQRIVRELMPAKR